LGEQPAVIGPAELFTIDEVWSAIEKSKDKKASGPSGVVAEMLKSSVESGVMGMLNICNAVINQLPTKAF